MNDVEDSTTFSVLMRYGTLGIVTTTAAISLLYVLTRFAHVPYLAAHAIAHLAVTTIAFIPSSRWVFRRPQPVLRGLIKYHAGYLLQFAVSALCLVTLVELIAIPVVPAQVISLVVAVCFSFGYQRLVVFGRADDDRIAPDAPATTAEQGSTQWQFWAVVGGVVMSADLFYYWIMSRVSLMGDEHFYYRTARALWALVGLGPNAGMAAGDAYDSIIGAGWFLPGTPLLLSPVGLFDSGLTLVRGYIGVVNLALLAVTTVVLHRLFGRVVAAAYALIFALYPVTGLFSFVIWGDLPGAQLMVILALVVFALARRVADGGDIPSITESTLLAMGMVVAVYIRPPFVFVAPFLMMVFVLGGIRATGLVGAVRLMVPRALLVTVIVLIGVAPWSYAVSREYGGPYLLTTTSDLSWILAFADNADASLDGNGRTGFYEWHTYLVDQAAESGRSYSEVLAEEREAAAANVTFDEYRARAWRNERRFLGGINGFPARFGRLAADTGEFGPELPAVMPVLLWVNQAGWLVLTVMALVLPVLDIVRRSDTAWLSALNLALLVVVVLLPLVSAVHGRHLVYFVPMMLASTLIAASSTTLNPTGTGSSS